MTRVSLLAQTCYSQLASSSAYLTLKLQRRPQSESINCKEKVKVEIWNSNSLQVNTQATIRFNCDTWMDLNVLPASWSHKREIRFPKLLTYAAHTPFLIVIYMYVCIKILKSFKSCGCKESWDEFLLLDKG